MNSIRWGATGEGATITRNPELEPKLPGREAVGSNCGNSQRPDAEEKTAGGIIIPDTAKEKPQKGTIIAVGPGKKKDEPMTVKPGDKVLYGKYAGTEITIDGKDYLIMRQDDIFGNF